MAGHTARGGPILVQEAASSSSALHLVTRTRIQFGNVDLALLEPSTSTLGQAAAAAAASLYSQQGGSHYLSAWPATRTALEAYMVNCLICRSINVHSVHARRLTSPHPPACAES